MDQESETNLVDLDSQPTSRPAKSVRVKFNEECMFLAACAAGDKDEVCVHLENSVPRRIVCI